MFRLFVQERLSEVPQAPLIDRYGADQNMVDPAADILAADYPKVIANQLTDLGGVIYPDLLPRDRTRP